MYGFILSGDTDYVMNFNPDCTDRNAYVGVDPDVSVAANVEAAYVRTYEQLYDNHIKDYSSLYDRVDIAINPDERFDNKPTPPALQHIVERLSTMGWSRYILISGATC